MLHITCNMCTRDLPDMYALSPAALGLRAYISGKSLVPMLQLLLNILLICKYSVFICHVHEYLMPEYCSLLFVAEITFYIVISSSII